MPEMPKNAQHLFDELIPAALSAHPDRAKEVNAIYGFNITGDGGGQWTVDLVSEPPTCVKGDTGKAQCAIEVAAEDFNAMLANPQLGMQLYFQGKLRVTGDPMLATKLQKFFEMANP
jgi:hypothetical protein